MSNRIKQSLVLLYTAIIILSIVFWIIHPTDIIHFVGASSLAYAFLIAMAIGRCFTSFLLLAWIPLFLIGIIICCLIAIKKKKYSCFSVTIGLEILVSLLLVLVKLFVLGNTYSITILVIGLLVRSIICGGIIFYLLKR